MSSTEQPKDELTGLLAKTRRLNSAFLSAPDEGGSRWSLMASRISEVCEANAFFIARDGRFVTAKVLEEYKCPHLERRVKEGKVSRDYLVFLNGMAVSVRNTTGDSNCTIAGKGACKFSDKCLLFAPIIGRGERFGTMILSRFGLPFTTSDLVLAEYLASVISLEIVNAHSRQSEERERARAAVLRAIRSLSFSELESIRHIMRSLDGDEGVVVSCMVADNAGVTRSIVVNALRKLCSAGIIESRSLGMKGTFIKVVRREFFDELGIDLSSGLTGDAAR